MTFDGEVYEIENAAAPPPQCLAGQTRTTELVVHALRTSSLLRVCVAMVTSGGEAAARSVAVGDAVAHTSADELHVDLNKVN